MNPLPWGTLTGIRPAKVAQKLLASGKSERETIQKLIKTYKADPGRAALCTETAQKTLAFSETLKPKDIALYIGIPFCPSRCTYCSFVSNNVTRSFNLVEPFIETLLNEIDTIAKLTRELGLNIVAVYMGGGTPTALTDAVLEVVMASLNKSFDLSNLREYTVEAGRPDTITETNLNIMIREGATRISINPQSMRDEVLSAIGRKHSAADVYTAVKNVRKTDLALNMDIIAGLPCDTPSGFAETLDTVIKYDPENITVHTLSLKKGSRIMLEGTDIPSGEAVGEMLDYASCKLRESAYSPYYVYRQKYITGGYENIGWSVPGHEGVYNISMMEEMCTVLAVGGGGVTKLVMTDGRIERIFNAKYPREYILMTEKIKDKVGRIKENAISI